MFDREDYNHAPDLAEISNYINNPLWDDFCSYLTETYRLQPTFDFSKCSWEPGWNVKFKKNGKSLCTLYPRENFFVALIVIGQKEKPALEEILSSLSSDIQQLYHETEEGNGQKWLMIELEDNDKRYDDLKRMIKIRSGKK